MPSHLASSFDDIRRIRARHPAAVRALAESRARRDLLRDDGRLLIIAADHPARAAIGVRGDAMAMASRRELLRRLVIALENPDVDGVLATPDIVEDLLMLGALHNKIVIGSMNRAGLQGASFELDDRFSAYDADAIARARFDGGKMLCRISLNDAGTSDTLTSCAAAINALSARRRIALIEPFWSSRVGDRIHNDLTAESVIRAIHVVQALGTTSAYTWLKLPVVEDMERVMDSTTLPTLLLGGDPDGHPEDTYASWRKALDVPGVRGLVVGRALLYPPDDDVAAAVSIAASLIRPASRTPAVRTTPPAQTSG